MDINKSRPGRGSWLALAALTTALLCWGSTAAAAETAVKKQPPNIILIMADDIGIECFGCYGGSSYQTSRIDALAAQGMRYTHAYSQPLCTPTRLELMTGKDNHRNWRCFGIMPPDEKTIGHYMQQAGYKTCISGKWQLQSYDPVDYPGAAERRGTGMHAEDSGFDQYQLYHALHTEDKGSRYADPTFLRNGELHKDLTGKYGEDLNVDFIIEFLRSNRDDPLFVYYPMALPHWPMVPTPWSSDWQDPAKRQIADERYFPDMVRYMDHLVGRIVDEVDRLGDARETLILFYSDNGTHLAITSEMGKESIPGGKAMPTQAGIRVPLIARWTGTIEPSVCRDLIDASDFLPTLVELAGGALEPSKARDGISFAGSFLGENVLPKVMPQKREACFFWYDPRPGWDKDRFRRHIFALDHQYKLFADGRLFQLDDLKPIEKELKPEQRTPGDLAAMKKLQAVIDQMMRPPMSRAATLPPLE